MNAFLPLGLRWVERQVRIKQEEVLDVDKKWWLSNLKSTWAAKGMHRVPLLMLCEGNKKAQKSDPSQRHFRQATANRHWPGHTAVTHGQEVADSCWAPALSQIKTWARSLPELCSTAAPHGSSRSALSEASFVLCLARSEALKIISCISWNPLMPTSWSPDIFAASSRCQCVGPWLKAVTFLMLHNATFSPCIPLQWMSRAWGIWLEHRFPQ